MTDRLARFLANLILLFIAFILLQYKLSFGLTFIFYFLLVGVDRIIATLKEK